MYWIRRLVSGRRLELFIERDERRMCAPTPTDIGTTTSWRLTSAPSWDGGSCRTRSAGISEGGRSRHLAASCSSGKLCSRSSNQRRPRMAHAVQVALGGAPRTIGRFAVASDPHVFLIGRPPIGELLGFIRTMAVDGQSVDFGDLTAEWRAANDHVVSLEREEGGAADDPPITPLPESLRPLAEDVTADAVFKRAYRLVPTEIAMIDLNRVVVFQKFINLSYVEMLKQVLGSAPSVEAVFNFSLPLQPEQPQFQMMQNGPNMFTILSPSTDFRFLDAQVLRPESVPCFDSTGRPVAIIGLS